jgi:CPA2 family monovalent cation:H+ antiporter-2
LRDLRISGDLIIVSIHRGREVRVPHGNTQLERGDVLTVLGDEDSVKDFKEKVEG